MFALWLCTLPFFYVHFAGGVGLLLSVLAATFAAWLAASAFAMAALFCVATIVFLLLAPLFHVILSAYLSHLFLYVF